MKKAVFLDRDGTLNPDPGYISDPNHFDLFPGVVEALKKISQAGYELILITNQSGIARGLITFEQLDAIHDKLKKILAQGGVSLSAIYFCPHHPDFPPVNGISRCDCRKPGPAMILQAIKEHQIDPAQSYMVGDKSSDIKLGYNAGVTPVFIGEKLPEGFEEVVAFSSLRDAADWIVADQQQEKKL
ncbi:MAG: D-glycero-D-manno-heptose 1,7-bisphosphate phosphatase [Clostridiales bacterium]|jgi:D,D-heptose 1,7-bisphosphate phosphatase|nr:D-glycero-D-manno-heptose 1,7-bisphosphate phosphatase [Clostridiales bacterium]MDN5281446.1 D-glycero-D-manno-heptose 1,7-bisphosphate phosphatase [Candidatus Ozemobacter sp.]